MNRKHPKPSAPPRQELPPAYDPSSVEDRLYAQWEASGFFNPDNLPGERAKPFTVIMPPPNVTGTLHIGHAMFLTLEDIMIRFERMRGKAALWLPGTDHAAIATNTKVEKILVKEGKTKYDLGREGFLKRVEEFIAGSQATIHNQIRKMGASCDWSREAYTLDAPRSAAVREMFVRMYRDGLIYRGYRIVNWCPQCESTLADDEVEYREEKGNLYYMKYGPFTVATTRPETKLGDTAAAVNPKDARHKKWIGQTFSVDFGIGPQEIRVIADEGIDMAFGSGVVGVTPAHSAVDFAMAERNALPIKKVIGEDGKMTALAGKYAGMKASDARAALIADLEKRGQIEKVEEITHNVSLCYRSGDVVEPLTSRQWFIAVDKMIPGRKKTPKRLGLEAVTSGGVEIIPERFEKVYRHWMENLRDWCISRQIWFGHRIPVWYCQSCYVEEGGEARAGAPAATVRHPGIIVATETPTECWNCKRRPPETSFLQDPDTLDTWFSSGTWTFSTLGWPDKTKDLRRFHPTQVLETGYDILFFWVARMVLMAEYALGEVPFEKVYLHGLVRDEHGRKMSKSLGNIIDPLDVAAKYGTDAVRLSLVVGASPGNDVKLSDEKIAHFRNFANKLWNIARFIGLTCGGTVPMVKTAPVPKTLADKWALARLDDIVRSITTDLEALNFSRPGETLRDFTWTEFADWYLEIAKIEKGKEKMLAYILYTLLRLWHPFMPFVTEEIHRLTFAAGDKDFLMVASWPKVAKRSTSAKKTLADFALLQNVIVGIRNIRSTYRVEPGKKIDVAVSAGDKEALLKKNADVICGLARVGTLNVAAKTKRPAGAAHAAIGGVQLYVPLGSLIDVVAEKARIGKEIADTERYLANQEGKLKNKDFVARAPAHIIAGERQKLRDAEEKLAKLREQSAALG